MIDKSQMIIYNRVNRTVKSRQLLALFFVKNNKEVNMAKKEKDTHLVGIMLSTEMNNKLRSYADKYEVPISFVVRLALNYYFDTIKDKPFIV